MISIDNYLNIFRRYKEIQNWYIPEKGVLAGRSEILVNSEEVFQYDNMHYPLGDAFYKYGISGIIREANKKEFHNNQYMRAVVEVYNIVKRYILQHAEKSMILCEKADTVQKKKHFAKIADNCNWLAENPPKTFEQALQLFWFMYIIRSYFGGGCIGRLDQHLYPFYKGDRSDGRITEEKAKELIIEFYNNLNKNFTGDTLRNMMLSGQDERGSDETNELTYLFLKAYEETGDAEPHLNVRIHSTTPEKILKMCITLMGTGKGQPTLYFDDNIIPAMQKSGIDKKFCCKYANDGCTETVIDGASSISFFQHEMVKTVELTLFNGKENAFIYPISMKKSSKNAPDIIQKTSLILGIKTGNPENMKTFQNFYDAFERQLTKQINNWIKIIDEKILLDETLSITSPLVAGTFKECLSTGKDPLRGGGFTIANYQLLSGSIGTSADCLLGIKKAVFDYKWCTIKELMRALESDFKHDEILRKKLLNLPKYGNGNEEVDRIARRIAKKFLKLVNSYESKNGKKIWPGLYNIDFKTFANITGATPDGRKFRDAIGEHCSPTPGAAQNGPTAIIESAAQIPMNEGYASSPLHITLDKGSFIMGADRDEIIHSILVTAWKRKIPVLNISMYEKSELLEAQKCPEKFRSLIVRVWGFNARFVELDSELQDHIIKRIV